MYDNLNMSKGLCPPLGHPFTIKGKQISQLFKQLRITIKRCNDTINPYCANDTIFTNY